MLGRWEALERKRVEADQVRAATELLEGASTSAAGLQSSTERLAKERQLFDQEEAFSAPLEAKPEYLWHVVFVRG